MRRGGEPKPIKALVDSIVKSTGVSARADIDELNSAWQKSVPPHVAAHTRVINLKSQVLSVLVASAALKHEIESFMRDPVLEKLTAALPHRPIAKLRLVLANPGAVR